jgi:hypothetical protein
LFVIVLDYIHTFCINTSIDLKNKLGFDILDVVFMLVEIAYFPQLVGTSMFLVADDSSVSFLALFLDVKDVAGVVTTGDEEILVAGLDLPDLFHCALEFGDD